MNILRLLGAFLCISTLYTQPIYAVSVLDQSNIPSTQYYSHNFGPYGTGGIDYQLAQTFIVGLTGRLDGVDLYLGQDGAPTENVSVDIVSSVNLSGAALATGVLTPLDIPTTQNFVYIDLSTLNFSVSSGDALAIRLSTTQNIISNVNQYNAGFNLLNGYNDGVFHTSSDGGVNWNPQGAGASDLFFKTYVSAVPVPAAVWLFASGLLGLVGIARRKKAA